MNPMALFKSAKAAKEALKFLSSKNASETLANAITKRSVTNPATSRAMRAQANPDFPAEVMSTMGSRTVVPSPQEVAFEKMLAPFDVRDARNTDKFLRELQYNQARMMPVADRINKINRRTGFGVGLGAGALPPSIYALWLMSQDEDNEE